ncbi:hypothetical protein [Pantanalinema sp. GBBB05]|uniref:hypothetical protein n=1 Tax=Pantanalinema sp. GBBB05 TaxID=2604139 RepID=UPI001DA70FB6|nr:hypothetical protein [Pantanalinema sp. GBBB05]
MVASPEVCRINGAKSKGAVTPRGKAIASRNATKHGLLAKQPPLLVTEDLATFEGLLQGLIDHYEPSTPVEHFLIQQVAMGMLKQYRLWGVEAAIANIEILKSQQETKFPDVVIPPKITTFGNSDFSSQRVPLKDELTREKNLLEGLLMDLEHYLSHLEELNPAATIVAFHDACNAYHYSHSRMARVYECQDEFEEWLEECWDSKRKKYTADFQEAIARVTRLVELGKQRVQEIELTLGELAAIEQGIQQAKNISKGMHKQELFSRYQRNINRELYEALDRLDAIYQQKNEASMGSLSII